MKWLKRIFCKHVECLPPRLINTEVIAFTKGDCWQLECARCSYKHLFVVCTDILDPKK